MLAWFHMLVGGLVVSVAAQSSFKLQLFLCSKGYAMVWRGGGGAAIKAPVGHFLVYKLVCMSSGKLSTLLVHRRWGNVCLVVESGTVVPPLAGAASVS